MATITRVEIKMIDLVPKITRTDAIQSFVSQETPIVIVHDSDGAVGTGYTYTIGTGGPAVVSLLERTLAPALIGKDPSRYEQIWRDLLFLTHATAVGAITSLALAAIDTALWDLNCRKNNQPLWKAAGGVRDSIRLYTTEGGWMYFSEEQLVENALEAKEQGFKGSKIKIGSEHIALDRRRLAAVRDAVGDEYEIMTDANQSYDLSQAIRAAGMLDELDIAWFEEPMPADDIGAHVELSHHSGVPIAVGESMYSPSQFKDYLQLGAASIVQVDVARVGGITPWLKVAHMAECFNVAVCPHFLMELHLPLICAVPNAKWLEYIPQLESVTRSGMQVVDGKGVPSNDPGLGIDWDLDAIARMVVVQHDIREAA
ncbi:mandelate racemase [Ruegeria sp. ANG-R]|uniref:mandelate racemase/muconate lactonizing enzyme family protein n=1 Tax=Ruegeria sp. ANG-R TaxID=1577903 RepID=UPI00057E5EEE|nr:mandelate racemase/muconate lactonizing enzyme family protein [Ruegeria sp. ANG-R]KIC37074.1 mandelate racemase [Ruegeria sp. ANG-R]